MERLSLEQTQLLAEVRTLDELEELLAIYGYDESEDSDLIYETETITYTHRRNTGVK